MDGTNIDLRPIGRSDRAAWASLWAGYLEHYRTALPRAAHDSAFEQLLSNEPGTFRGLIAWEGTAALGLVHWLHHAHMWRPEGVVYLQDLFIVPAARGQGLARRLIEAVYADADARGAPSVYWLTKEDNYPARMLYDRIGRRSAFIKYDRPT